MILKKLIKNWHWILISLFFWIIALKCIPTDFCDLGGDSAQYITLAESLAQGKGLRMLNYPGEPFYFYYPPVFALLLYPIIKFWGRNFYIMHLLIALFGYASLYVMYQLFKKYADKKIAVFSTCLMAINWAFILYSSEYILSDIPYLFFSLFVLSSAAIYLKKHSSINKEGILLLFGLCLTYFTRYIGITLYLGLLILFLVTPHKTKIKKIIFIGGVFLIVFGLWNACKTLLPSPMPSHLRLLFLIDPYASYKGSLLANPLFFIFRFIDGTNYYYTLLSQAFFFSPLTGYIQEAACSLILGLLFLGFWRKFKENKECVFHYYFIAYLLLLIFWPFHEGVRFLIPILPFIYFYFLSGLHTSLLFIFKRLSSLFFYLVISVGIFFTALGSFRIAQASYQNCNTLPKPLENFIVLHEWIKDNLKDSIILSRKSSLTYFYTGNKSLCYPFTKNPDEIFSFARKNKASYIIIDEFSKETYYYLTPFLKKYNTQLELLQKIGKTGIFKIRE